MKRAIVTGASSGIGLAIVKYLIGKGYGVTGVSRRSPVIDSEHYCHLSLDLSDKKWIVKFNEFVKTQKCVDLFIYSAGFGLFGPHETISSSKISDMIEVNLSAPIIMTGIILKKLIEIKGHIIFISSITAKKPAPSGAAYSATKSGLLTFADNLFEEHRKLGLKVTTILPDITKTPFYDNLNFSPSSDPYSYIEPECVVNTIDTILKSREGTVISEVIIRPQKLIIDKKKYI